MQWNKQLQGADDPEASTRQLPESYPLGRRCTSLYDCLFLEESGSFFLEEAGSFPPFSGKRKALFFLEEEKSLEEKGLPLE